MVKHLILKRLFVQFSVLFETFCFSKSIIHNCIVQRTLVITTLFVTKDFADILNLKITVKILKIGTPEIITIIVLHLEQLDFTVQYCVQKMQTE